MKRATWVSENRGTEQLTKEYYDEPASLVLTTISDGEEIADGVNPNARTTSSFSSETSSRESITGTELTTFT